MKDLYYAGAFRGLEPVAEYKEGANATKARKFALAIAGTAKPGKGTSYTCDNMSGHCLGRQGGDLLIVVCGANVPRRIPFNLLAKIDKQLQTGAGGPAANLKEAIATFDDNDAIEDAQTDIDQVRSIMIENVDKLLERGERIGLLVDRTEGLSSNATNFRKSASAARSKFWWRNVRMTALIAFVVVVFILLVYFFF